MRVGLVGDRDLLDFYSMIVGPGSIVASTERLPVPEGARFYRLPGDYASGAARLDVYMDYEARLDEVAENFRGIDALISELEGPVYTALLPFIIRKARPKRVLVEMTRFTEQAMAALKELSLLSHSTPILVLHRPRVPRSRKLRATFVETLVGSRVDPGFYTYRVKRLKSYIRAWLWYHEARSVVDKAKGSGVPEFLVIDLETRLSEAERLLRGSEFTIVFPSVHDIKQPPGPEMYKTAPILFPAGPHKAVETDCHASIELVEGGLVVGCKPRNYLNEEAIFLWLVKLAPTPAWRGEVPDEIRDAYSRYRRRLEESPRKLHPRPPSDFLPEMEAPWRVIPMYSMDTDGLVTVEAMLRADLSPIVKIAHLAAACRSDVECSEAVEKAEANLEEVIKRVVEDLPLYRDLALLYRSVVRALNRELRVVEPLTIPDIGLDELQENLALLSWVLQASYNIDPALADALSINAQALSEIINIIRGSRG